MKKFLFNATHILAGAICFFLMFASTGVFAQDYKIDFSGGGGVPAEEVATDDVIIGIVNGEEVELEHNSGAGTSYGKGTFGNIVNQGAVDFVFDYSWQPCENNIGYQVAHYLRHTNVLRAANGDMLFREMSESLPSVMCVDLVEEKLKALIHLDIVGGTGRFEGATGNATNIYEIIFLPSGATATVGTEEGYVDK